LNQEPRCGKDGRLPIQKVGKKRQGPLGRKQGVWKDMAGRDRGKKSRVKTLPAKRESLQTGAQEKREKRGQKKKPPRSKPTVQSKIL